MPAEGMKARLGWSRQFDGPISLPSGRQLVTLKDAADYTMKLPKADQDLEEWQTAIGCLIGAAEGRDFLMHARIGVLRALNRNAERMLTDRKDSHWGKRKLSGTNDCPAGMADAPQLHALTEPMSYISPHHDRAPEENDDRRNGSSQAQPVRATVERHRSR
jgi:hypothetical protein